jgi:hypothetical protein
MEFLLLDLALAFAALLGYRMLQEVARRGIALGWLESGTPRRATPPAKLARGHALREAISRKPAAPPPLRAEAPCQNCAQAAPHRLINFW